MKTKTRKQYNPKFKKAIVKSILSEVMTKEDAIVALDVTRGTINKWIQDYSVSINAVNSQQPKSEVEKLVYENTELKNRIELLEITILSLLKEFCSSEPDNTALRKLNSTIHSLWEHITR